MYWMYSGPEECIEGELVFWNTSDKFISGIEMGN